MTTGCGSVYLRPSSVAIPLLQSFLTARSLGRGVSLPKREGLGFSVDTESDAERRRYVYAAPTIEISAMAESISEPRVVIKLLGSMAELDALLTPDWHVALTGYFMIKPGRPSTPRSMPINYRLKLTSHGPVVRAVVKAPDGSVAATGQATAAMGVYMYDRIETADGHRRQGIGAAMMTALALQGPVGSEHVLTASPDGRHLYASLGWKVCSEYSTAHLLSTAGDRR